MRTSTRIFIAITVLVLVVVAVRLLPVGEWLRDFQTWVRAAGTIGYIAYVGVYAVCVVFLVPATILTIGAGAIFGVVAGSLVVLAGATLGATLAFILARTLLRKRVEAKVASSPKFAALDRAIAREGAKIVLLIRLSPLFPFTYVNYIFGATGIGLVPYVTATAIGILPATVAFVYLSDAAASAATGGIHDARVVINIAVAVLAVIASVVVARVAAKAVRQAGVETTEAPR